MSPDGKGCVDRNECLDRPCLNGARCENLEPRLRYRCVCLDGFYGENCELIQEGQTLKLSMGALAAILVCLLIILSECAVLAQPHTHAQPFFHPTSFIIITITIYTRHFARCGSHSAIMHMHTFPIIAALNHFIHQPKK